MKKLNLGIIGTGWPGQMHAEAICATRLANIYACADVDQARREFFEKSYAPEKSYTDYHELLQDRHVDAAIICLPNFLHFPASLAALEAGKHVLFVKAPNIKIAGRKILSEKNIKTILAFCFSPPVGFFPVIGPAQGLAEEGRTR